MIGSNNKPLEKDNIMGKTSEETIAENPSVVMDILHQLRKGKDLSRITLPTFFLEPRSMLEKITDFMSHPELAIEATNTQDPIERFVKVCKFFLSGWHNQPKTLKKPYNPILGEFFRCNYELEDGSKASYISEQISHHPPVSAYYYTMPNHGITITGEAHPKARFYGTSIASIMKGYTRIEFGQHSGETYEISNPNVYVYGILLGKKVMDLGDSSTIRCPDNGLICELTFKSKGMVFGQNNSVVGKIKKEESGEVLYEIFGIWTEELFIKKANCSSKESYFNVEKSPVISKTVEPLENQEWNESRKLWLDVTNGLNSNNMDKATDAKNSVEDNQRKETAARQKNNIQWNPRFFTLNDKKEYEFNETAAQGSRMSKSGGMEKTKNFNEEHIPSTPQVSTLTTSSVTTIC